MGRSLPNDKLLLVRALRKKGHIVAMRGDGTNDAPALLVYQWVFKEPKFPRKVIILCDNFASVVKVVRWGKSVSANVQKFIQFQLTVNVAAVAINFVAALAIAISAGEVPLTAVQLLWVNLITDTLGALALATEPPTDYLMDRPPIGQREALITNIMWRNLGQAMYHIVVLFTLQFRGIEILKLQHHSHACAELVKNTIIFNAFVWCQIFNEFNARKHDQINIFKGLLESRLFVAIIAFTVALQILIIQFDGRVASTTKLNWQL